MVAQRDSKPANTRRWRNVGLLLGQRLRRWHNNKTTLRQNLVFAGTRVCAMLRRTEKKTHKSETYQL